MSRSLARLVKFRLCQSEGCVLRPTVATHVVVTEQFGPLEHDTATAISYTWGEFNREKRCIGHYESGTQVWMELGVEWQIADLVTTLHELCNRVGNETKDRGPELCWIDQLCIRQDIDKEVRETLAKIPDIYRTFDVAVLLPGPRCACSPQRLRWMSSNAKRKRGLYPCCPNDVSYLTWLSRLWTRKEFLNAGNIRLVWTAKGTVRCPRWWNKILDHVDIDLWGDKADSEWTPQGPDKPVHDLTSSERSELSPIAKHWLESWERQAQPTSTDSSSSTNADHTSLPWMEQQERAYNVVNGLWLDSIKTFSSLLHIIHLWKVLHLQEVDPSHTPYAVSALSFLAGERLVTSGDVEKEGEWPFEMRRFLVSLYDMGISHSVATKQRDYVLATFVDCPQYTIPLDFRIMPFRALLQDAMTQVSTKSRLKLATHTPASLFGPLSSTSLYWDPSAYIDGDLRIPNAGCIFGPVLPYFLHTEDRLPGPYAVSENRTRRAQLSRIGALRAVESHSSGERSLLLLVQMLEAALSWQKPEFMQGVLSTEKTTVNNWDDKVTEYAYHYLLQNVGVPERGLEFMRCLARGIPDIEIDTYSIVRRIVGHSIGLSTEIIERHNLRLMMRSKTAHCPPLLGLTWRDLNNEDIGKASFPMRLHFCNDFENCTNDDRCEIPDSLPILYEVAENVTRDGRRERRVFGVYAPTRNVPGCKGREDAQTTFSQSYPKIRAAVLWIVLMISYLWYGNMHSTVAWGILGFHCVGALGMLSVWRLRTCLKASPALVMGTLVGHCFAILFGLQARL